MYSGGKRGWTKPYCLFRIVIDITMQNYGNYVRIHLFLDIRKIYTAIDWVASNIYSLYSYISVCRLWPYQYLRWLWANLEQDACLPPPPLDLSMSIEYIANGEGIISIGIDIKPLAACGLAHKIVQNHSCRHRFHLLSSIESIYAYILRSTLHRNAPREMSFCQPTAAHTHTHTQLLL